MMRLIADVDCGNAPKKQILLDRTVAMAKDDEDGAFDPLADDVEWELVGRRTIRGRSEAAKVAQEILGEPAKTLRVFEVLSHGKLSSINGRIEFASGRAIDFCDVHEFTSNAKTAKIARITS